MYALIYNTFDQAAVTWASNQEDESDDDDDEGDHEMMTAPLFAQKYDSSSWVKLDVQRYPQH